MGARGNLLKHFRRKRLWKVDFLLVHLIEDKIISLLVRPTVVLKWALIWKFPTMYCIPSAIRQQYSIVELKCKIREFNSKPTADYTIYLGARGQLRWTATPFILQITTFRVGYSLSSLHTCWRSIYNNSCAGRGVGILLSTTAVRGIAHCEW